MDPDRRAALELRRSQVRYAGVQREFADELAEYGFAVDASAFLSSEECQAAWAALDAQPDTRRVWHRIWGVEVRAEMVSTVHRLADVLDDVPVTLASAPTVPAACTSPLITPPLRTSTSS